MAPSCISNLSQSMTRGEVLVGRCSSRFNKLVLFSLRNVCVRENGTATGSVNIHSTRLALPVYSCPSMMIDTKNIFNEWFALILP